MPRSMTAFRCVSVIGGLQYSVEFFVVFIRMENVQGKITTNNFCWKKDSFTCLVPDQFTSQITKMVLVFHYIMKFLLEAKGAQFMVLKQTSCANYVRNGDSKTSRSAGNTRFAGPGLLLTCSSSAGSLKISGTRLAATLQHLVGARGTGSLLLSWLLWSGIAVVNYCHV